jgi:DNA-directed RNA polymerase subunit RPC12/RpoP
MAFSLTCWMCGHLNQPEAKTCAMCQRPLDRGIEAPMNCPRCGDLNGAGCDTCVGCGYDLEQVAAIPFNQRTLPCPYCNAANPPLVQSEAAVYCIRCGREIRLSSEE